MSKTTSAYGCCLVSSLSDNRYWVYSIHDWYFAWSWFVKIKPVVRSMLSCTCPDSRIHGANMGPTWLLSAPDGPHVGPMNLALRVYTPGLLHWHWGSYGMYQILKTFDIHWHGGGPSIAIWCIILEGSPICFMIEKVVYCVIWKILYYIVPYCFSEIN